MTHIFDRNRREFIMLVGDGAVAWPRAARAQQAGSIPRIGVVYPGPQVGATPRVQAVLEGVRAGGYSQVEVVLRVADGDPSRIVPLVAEVIASKVDVLFAIGPAVARAARSATPTLPIVAIDLQSDPVETGWAASLAHPGGNITGVHGFPGFCQQMVRAVERDTPPALSRRRSMGSIHGITSKKRD